MEGLRVSLAGVLFDFGATGIGKIEHASDLIKSLARSVVDGMPHQLVISKPLDIDEESVASGNDKPEVRRHLAGFEKW